MVWCLIVAIIDTLIDSTKLIGLPLAFYVDLGLESD
jgi:hypothetical protein